MTSKEKLIKFMELKHDIFFKATGIQYFTERDKNLIKKWRDEDCDRIFDTIESNILFTPANSIAGAVCPFCIFHRGDCNQCTYSRLDICITCYFYNTQYNLYELLSNKVYREILEKVNNEDTHRIK